MRRKQVFTLLHSGIELIRFRAGEKDFEVKQENQKWVLRKPAFGIAAEDEMHALLTELNTLFVKEFLDGTNSENPEFGLQSSGQALRIQFQDRSKQTIVLGAAAAGKDAYYAKLSEPAAVVLLAKGKIDKIEQTFEALAK